ncbi:hypothetical protein GF391_00895 [Candidatus Uhrbacteria bacterium]|nr:hypothetical protein [Candidatus Uhrbacteria bacterium]
MPEQELMYFFIAGTRKSADVIRTFADDRPIYMVRPSSTLYEKAVMVRVGDMDDWETANQELAQAARDLGILNLNNLNPPDDMMEAARKGARIRARLAGL